MRTCPTSNYLDSLLPHAAWVYRVFTGDPGPRPEKMLDNISCPVLVAWGEEDPWTPLNGSVGKFFQRQAVDRDNVDLVTLPGTGTCTTSPTKLVIRL